METDVQFQKRRKWPLEKSGASREISRQPKKRKDRTISSPTDEILAGYTVLFLLYKVFCAELEVLSLIDWFIVPISTADT